MTVKLAITAKRYAETVTIDMQIALEDQAMTHKLIRQFIAGFAVDEAGDYLPEAEALAAVGGLTLAKATETAQQLYGEITRLDQSQPPLASSAP
jgi:hypothetical protein